VSIAKITIELNSGDFLDTEGRKAALALLIGMLASFGFIRMSTRLMRSPKVPWWPGSVKTGGVHVHHLVFGIVLMMLAGFLEFAFQPDDPWTEIFAAGFGIGVGLTLDEFALWLYLEDVYWAEEGRRSVDAVIIATVIAGAVAVGAAPIGQGDTGSVLTIMLTMAVVLVIAAIAAVKGKYWSALVGVFFLPVAIVAAIRLARPDSPWARRFYGEGSDKLARCAKRDERTRRRYRRWQDLIGGAPSHAEPADDG
jgi:hypothetical protein